MSIALHWSFWPFIALYFWISSVARNANFHRKGLVSLKTKRAKKSNRARMQLIPEILRSHEEQGNVMRYLRVEGEIAWRATLLMPPKLADLQRDADEDLADWP